MNTFLIDENDDEIISDPLLNSDTYNEYILSGEKCNF